MENFIEALNAILFAALSMYLIFEAYKSPRSFVKSMRTIRTPIMAGMVILTLVMGARIYMISEFTAYFTLVLGILIPQLLDMFVASSIDLDTEKMYKKIARNRMRGYILFNQLVLFATFIIRTDMNVIAWMTVITLFIIANSKKARKVLSGY